MTESDASVPKTFIRCCPENWTYPSILQRVPYHYRILVCNFTPSYFLSSINKLVLSMSGLWILNEILQYDVGVGLPCRLPGFNSWGLILKKFYSLALETAVLRKALNVKTLTSRLIDREDLKLLTSPWEQITSLLYLNWTTMS